jgi:RHS repeat-associated protein
MNAFIRAFLSSRIFRGVLISLGLITAVSYQVAAQADSTIKSYRGTWNLVTPVHFYSGVYSCANMVNGGLMKQCVDNFIGTNRYTIKTPWQTNDFYVCQFGLYPPNSIECNTETVNDSNSSGGIYLGMTCPSGGSPNPYQSDAANAANIQGWCLEIGPAPPNPPLPASTKPEQNAGNPDACQCGGDPINIGAGNMYYEATDYKSSDGVAQFPLVFTRSYNSGIANQGASPDGADQTLGMGWTSNLLGSHLNIVTTLQSYDCVINNVDYICPTISFPVTVTVWHADGSQSVFTGQIGNDSASPSGAFIPQLGATGQLLNVSWVPYGNGNAGYEYLRMDGYSEFYDSNGLLRSVANPHGAYQHYVYDTNNRLIQIVNDGAPVAFDTWVSLSFQYDGSGRLSTVTNTAGGVYTYSYDSYNNLIKVQYPDNTYVQYKYENSSYPNALTGVVDENGNRYSTWGYDPQGRANSSQNGNGASIANNVTLIYNADGSADITEPTGLARHLTFVTINGKQLMVSASAPCTECHDKSKTISYLDINGNPYVSGVLYKNVTDFNGNVTKYVIDTFGRETSRIEAYGTQNQRTITTSWNPVLSLPEDVMEYNASSQLVRNTIYCYNSSSGNCSDGSSIGSVWTVNVADPVNIHRHVTTYTYNGATLTSIQGPRTDLTQTTNFNYGFGCSTGFCTGALSDITNALGYRSQITVYDSNAIPLKFVDPNNITTTLSYDARQRLKSKDVGGHLTQYNYDLAGNLTQVTLPTGGYIQYGYDTAHRLTSITDSETDGIVYTLDAMGNVTKKQWVNSANGSVKRAVQWAYDNYNRLTKEIDGMNQTTVYSNFDGNGHAQTITDPNGNITNRTFDQLNRLQSVIDAKGGNTTYNIDSLDHIIDVTDPRGLNTHYVVDAYGDALQVSSPDTGTSSYQYDEAGDLNYKADAAGHYLNYSYDALNRLKASYGDGSSINTSLYTYDQGYIGGLTGISSGAGSQALANTASYAYDAWGNVHSKTVTILGKSFTVNYSYDANNKLTQITFPSQNQSIIYTVDPLGFVLEVDAKSGSTQYPLASQLCINYLGQICALTYGNGLRESRSYDADARLTSISTPGVQVWGMSYDSDNNLASVSNSVNVNGSDYFTQAFSYDALNRVNGNTPGLLAYSYDANGSRNLKINAAGVNITFTVAPINNPVCNNGTSVSSNQLLCISKGQTKVYQYQYDLDGNVIADGTLNYIYDPRGRLSQVTNSAHATVASYVYDAFSQRVEKNTGGSNTTFFVYDEAGRLLADLNASGGISHVYAWMGDRPLAYFGAGGIGTSSSATYIHVDQTNTPRLLSNSSGAVGWEWPTEPFGANAPMAFSFGSDFNLGMPGQYYDAETGKYNNGFRDYDPYAGRYIESDPIGLGGGTNTYAYVGNNPVNSIDPLGLCNKAPAKPGNPDPADDPKYRGSYDDNLKHCMNWYLQAHYGDYLGGYVIPDNSLASFAKDEAAIESGFQAAEKFGKYLSSKGYSVGGVFETGGAFGGAAFLVSDGVPAVMSTAAKFLAYTYCNGNPLW